MVALTSALRDRWVRTRAFYSASFCRRRADGSTEGSGAWTRQDSSPEFPYVSDGFYARGRKGFAGAVGLAAPGLIQNNSGLAKDPASPPW